MRRIGNEVSNKKFNPNPSLHSFPKNGTDADMERFLRQKYEFEAFQVKQPPPAVPPKHVSFSNSNADPSPRSFDIYPKFVSQEADMVSKIGVLKSMGFFDAQKCRLALINTDGSLENAVLLLNAEIQEAFKVSPTSLVSVKPSIADTAGSIWNSFLSSDRPVSTSPRTRTKAPNQSQRMIEVEQSTYENSSTLHPSILSAFTALDRNELQNVTVTSSDFHPAEITVPRLNMSDTEPPQSIYRKLGDNSLNSMYQATESRPIRQERHPDVPRNIATSTASQTPMMVKQVPKYVSPSSMPNSEVNNGVSTDLFQSFSKELKNNVQTFGEFFGDISQPVQSPMYESEAESDHQIPEMVQSPMSSDSSADGAFWSMINQPKLGQKLTAQPMVKSISNSQANAINLVGDLRHARPTPIVVHQPNLQQVLVAQNTDQRNSPMILNNINNDNNVDKNIQNVKIDTAKQQQAAITQLVGQMLFQEAPHQQKIQLAGGSYVITLTLQIHKVE